MRVARCCLNAQHVIVVPQVTNGWYCSIIILPILQHHSTREVRSLPSSDSITVPGIRRETASRKDTGVAFRALSIDPKPPVMGDIRIAMSSCIMQWTSLAAYCQSLAGQWPLPHTSTSRWCGAPHLDREDNERNIQGYRIIGT
jgi:hypothetical protein